MNENRFENGGARLDPAGKLTDPVSVVIPYSPEHTPTAMLEEAKNSVRRQSVTTEIVVVYDEDQNGPAWARNVGLERADTRYVAFLDADDLWLENKLERQLRLMQETAAGLCVEGEDRSTERFIRDILAGDLSSLTSSALVDTAQVTARFEESLSRREDHLFMLEAASQAGVCLCPNLVIVRKHEAGLSSRDTASLLREEKNGFISAACSRVDEAESHLDVYYTEFYHRRGRSKHQNQQFVDAFPDLLLSILIKPRMKTIGALLITVFFILRERVR